MSRPKELNFFLDPACSEDLDLYSTFFEGGFPVRGESSPYYLASPLAPGVPERIARLAPQARLIALVRNPVSRLVSHYLDDYAEERENRSFADAVLAEIDDPHNKYLAPGRYVAQLANYAEHFPADQILVIDHEEMLVNRRATLERIFRFVGVDEHFHDSRFEQLTNTGAEKRRRGRLSRALRRHRVGAALRSLPLPEALASEAIDLVKRATSRRAAPPEIDEPTRERLEAYFRDEVAELRLLYGCSLGGWDT
jgi:hypothetical protein